MLCARITRTKCHAILQHIVTQMVDTEMPTLDIVHTYKEAWEKCFDEFNFCCVHKIVYMKNMCVCLVAIYSVRFSAFHSPCKQATCNRHIPSSFHWNVVSFSHSHKIFFRNFRTSWQYCSWELNIKLHISVRSLLPAAHSAMYTHKHTLGVCFLRIPSSLQCTHSSDDFCSFQMCVTTSLSLKLMCSHQVHSRTHTHTHWVCFHFAATNRYTVSLYRIFNIIAIIVDIWFGLSPSHFSILVWCATLFYFLKKNLVKCLVQQKLAGYFDKIPYLALNYIKCWFFFLLLWNTVKPIQTEE